MVGAGEVVVDGLRDTHAAHFIAVSQHELGDLVAGIHGVVAAVVEEVANVVLLEHGENLLIIGLVLVGILQLVAAGAQRRGGGVLHQGQLVRIFLGKIEQVVVQQTHDAVLHRVNIRDHVALQRGLDRAVGGSVNDGRRAAGLADDRRAFQHGHLYHSFRDFSPIEI